MRPRPFTFSAHASRLPSSETPIGVPTVSRDRAAVARRERQDVDEAADAEDGMLVVRAQLGRRVAAGRRPSRSASPVVAEYHASFRPGRRALERHEHVRRERDRERRARRRHVGDRRAGAHVEELDRLVGGGDGRRRWAGRSRRGRTRRVGPETATSTAARVFGMRVGGWRPTTR